MKMDRKKIVIKNSKETRDERINLLPEECVLLVWELTKEVYGLTGKHDVEQRLQRNVVNIIRK